VTAGGGPRVLLLLDTLSDSAAGAERTALTQAVMLPELGFEVWLCTTRHGSGEPLRRLAEANVHQLHLDRAGRVHLTPWGRLWRMLRRRQIDVLHAHMFGSNIWGASIGRAAGVPVVIAQEHSWAYQGDLVRRFGDAAIGRLADCFVAVSRADASLMTSYEWVPPEKVRVIPSAWTPRPAEGHADVRAELGIPVTAPVIGTVAVLRRVKRLELLVEAFSQVLRGAPDAWLLIGGGGPDQPVIEAAIERFGVRDRAVISGYREDVDSIWEAIDVAAMCSDREGTPVAALEAMRHGVPMVAPAVGGIPDVFEHGGGVLVGRHDADALGRELLALVQDPVRRAQIGSRGRERAQDFTAERQVDRFAELYRELLVAPTAVARRRRREGGAPRDAA
jgi:glycosyltransferase involved in cell wall biosynthesis